MVREKMPLLRFQLARAARRDLRRTLYRCAARRSGLRSRGGCRQDGTQCFHRWRNTESAVPGFRCAPSRRRWRAPAPGSGLRSHPGSKSRHGRGGTLRRISPGRRESIVHRRAELSRRSAVGDWTHPRRAAIASGRGKRSRRRLRKFESGPHVRAPRSVGRPGAERRRYCDRLVANAHLPLPAHHRAEHAVSQAPARPARRRARLADGATLREAADRIRLRTLRGIRVRPGRT